MAILLFFISFVTYLNTLYPTIAAFRDTGDLITSAYTLGIAHPPGYPVYVLFGKIWTLLVPFGNIGYRLNVFSAFTSSLCVAIVYLIAKKKFGSVWTGIITALIMAFSTAFWRQSILGEIYSLNALFAVLIVYLLVIRQSYALRLLVAFLFGFALGNHHTLVLLLPGIVYLVVAPLVGAIGRDKSCNYISPISHLPSLICVFLLGFSVYLFLPIRAAQQPVNNWGNPKNISNFFNVLTRADYGIIKLSSRHSGTTNTLTNSIKLYWRLIKNQFYLPGVILLIIGIFLSFRDISGKMILLLFVFTGPFFIFLSRLPDTEFSLAMLGPACVLPAVFTAIIIGMGIQAIVPKRIVPVFLLVPLYIGFINFSPLNKRYNFLVYDYAKNLIRSVPKNSFLSMTADIPIFTVNYIQNVEKRRQDIKVVLHSYMQWRLDEYEKKYPELFSQGKFGSTTDCLLKISSLPDSRQTGKYLVFTEGVHSELEEYSIPNGLICKISTDKNIFNRAKTVKKNLYLYQLYQFRKPKGFLDYYEKETISYYSSSCYNAGVVFARAGWKKESGAEFQRQLRSER